MKPRRSWLAALVLTAVVLVTPSCATNHLMNWSQGEPSTFGQPERSKVPFVRPAGSVLAFPVAVVWDVVTFPFQWIWGIYPYGSENAPSEADGIR